MARYKLTKSLVERADFEKDGQWITDTEFPQLLLRMTPTAKTFVARWKSPTNGRRQVSIATVGTISVEEARSRARKLVATDSAPASVETLADVYAIWDETYSSSVGLGHAREFRAAWKNHISSSLGRTKLVNLTPAAIQAFYQQARVNNAAATVNRWIAYISRLCSIAQANSWMVGNPTQSIERSTPHRRVTTFVKEDLVDLANNLTAVEAKYPIGVALIRFLAIQPCRGIEARTMRWEDIDLGRGLWTIPAENYKSGKDKVFPLPPLSRDILSSIPRWSDTYVFPSPGDRTKPMRKEYQRDIWEKVRPKPLGSHALRKTIATGLLNGGVPLEAVSKLLGHSSTAVTQEVYAHLDPVIAGQYLAKFSAKLFEEEHQEEDVGLTGILQAQVAMSIVQEQRAHEAEEEASQPLWKRTDPPPGLG